MRAGINKVKNDIENADVTKFYRHVVPEYIQKYLDRYGKSDHLKSFGASWRNEFSRVTDNLLRLGDEIVSSLRRNEQLRLRQQFRDAIQEYTDDNPFVRRCLDKPRGYPGDYMMMELGYDDAEKKYTGYSGILDRYFLDKYRSIISRKEKLKGLIKHHLMQSKARVKPLRVLTLGGGPCREWRELSTENLKKAYPTIVELTYLDQDDEAMEFARKRLKDNRLIKRIVYLKDSLFDFSRGSLLVDKKFDLIYGLGIADYFHDQVLTGIVRSAVLLLDKGGTFVLTHKDKEAFPMLPAAWFCDWNFVERSEEDFKKIFRLALRDIRLPVTFKLERERAQEIFFGIARLTQ